MLCEVCNYNKEAMFTSTKNTSVFADKQILFNNLKGIPSVIYKIIPPPEEDRPKRIGFSKTGVKN